MFGYPETFMISDPNSFLDRIHNDDREQYLRALLHSGKNLTVNDIHFRMVCNDGQTRWVHLTSTPERLENGDTTWYGHVIDITRQKAAELQMERMAYHDNLTGLPTRSVLEDRLEAAISAYERCDEYAALLFIDLDNFKALNDTLGHEMGDRLLRLVADRLKKIVRASDLAARYGGDEIVLLIDNLGKDEDLAHKNAVACAEKILKAFRRPFELADHKHRCTLSIGISMIGTGQSTAEEILRQADSAMYVAKNGGRNRYALYEDTLTMQRENAA